jgi:hypothetical protein
LLRTYTKDRLGRLIRAEEHLRSLYVEFQKKVIKQLETQRVPDFNYGAYDMASQSGRQQIVIQYLERKAKEDKEITGGQEQVIAESHVVPAAMELGVALIQHAQSQTDASARKSLLDEAEATFLSISRIAADREDYQLSMAEVHYWQGRQAQGRALFDKVLKDHKREPEWLLRVATLLRRVGSNSEARKLAEEGYEKASPGRVKHGCALIRGLLSDEIEERIRWIKLADTTDPNVKAILLDDQATEAMEKGEEQPAISYLRQADSIYQSMPESSPVLNNHWIVLNRLADLTGDQDARQRAAAMIARSAALDPSDSLALYNASASLLETALREVIGPSIDLNLLKRQPSLDEIGLLTKDEREREAYVTRIRNHPVVNRALSMMEKVILLAPQNPSFYQIPAKVLAFRRDQEALRKLLSTLERTELDLSDQAKRARETDTGQNDQTRKRAAQGATRLVEPILPVARAKGGATFAAAASMAIGSRIAVGQYGEKIDQDALVALAEEAYAKCPSVASRWYLITALLSRAAETLSHAESKFAAIRQRFFRSVSTTELIGALLSVEGPLKKRVLEDPDVNHALDLLKESHAVCPSYLSGPLCWSLLRARHPQDADAMARSFAKNESDRFYDEIKARLDPYDRTNTLKAYWRARMEHRENDALQVLKNASRAGYPIPIEGP